MEIELKQYFKIIWKRIWLIVALALVSGVTTAVVSYLFLDPVYQASTKLIVNDSAAEYSKLGQPNIDAIRRDLLLINTYKEIIKTPAIMDKVVEKYPDIGLSAAQLSQVVKVSSVNDTQVMTVAAQDESYERAAKIVNAVSKVFQSEIPSIMNVNNVTILNEAKTDNIPAPIKPTSELNIIISFAVALMLGIGIAFLLEHLDDTVKTEADVQQVLGLSTLAVISRINESEALPRDPAATNPQQVGEAKYAVANQ